MSGIAREGETRWLTRAQHGDEEAFARVVEAYSGPVYNLCYRMLGGPFEAEDAAQETFLKAFKALRRYDRDRPFKTWLLSIASHHCIDRLRRRRLNLVPLADSLGEEMAHGGPDPEQAMLAGERQMRVATMLERLKPKERAAIILRYWHDLSYREIGETLNLSTGAVKSRLHRARKELAQVWNTMELSSPAHSGVENEPSAV